MLAAADEYDAIRRQTPVRYSIRQGKIIAETKPSETTIQLGGEKENVTFVASK